MSEIRTGSDFEQMWRDLAPVGRSAASGGYFRQPWASAETELRSWFEEQARARGLEVETDGIGNQVAWWRPDGASGKGVLTGSHLDSVLDGGAYDGPLGVASALAALDRLAERGVSPSRPVGVGVFVEEEGSRFGRACLGSRLVTGAVAWDKVQGLIDRDGTRLADAVGDAGLDPTRGLLSLDDVGTFVELHVEQGRDLVHRSRAIGVASQIWPHGRWRFEFGGRANHAGTTLMGERHDPMLTFAMTALAANKQARLAGERATFGRVEVGPNSTNSIPGEVTAWLDARASSEEALAELVDAIARQGGERATRDGTSLGVTAESISERVDFDPQLAQRLASLHGWPVIPTQAGHDAGVLSAAGIPTAMLFVRNPTGVSHSPAETASMADCLAGVDALADVLVELIAAGPA